MSKETLSLKLGSFGVPEGQIDQLWSHLETAEKYIYPSDGGIESGMNWLSQSMTALIDADSASLLYSIADKNKPDPDVEYIEEGYDSCQSHRKISKVVGEAILIGGLIYEASLLGIGLDLESSKKYVGSTLKIEPEEAAGLVGIAMKYGAKQDFIFPGVTPSTDKTEPLEDLAYFALKGKPKTSVRTLTGVGGLRQDKDWNYASDMITFVGLKVSEDKRYYPGIGIFYLLKSLDVSGIPVLMELKNKNSKAYGDVLSFIESVKNTPMQEFSGVSVLCSAYLPSWDEMKTAQGFASASYLELADSFHSPSYEFSMLKSIFDQINSAKISDIDVSKQLAKLKKELSYCWTFNSTIHLPWTSELAGLSNGLIGSVTNGVGDYCIRYGVGYGGKSIEIREYNFGDIRNFPHGLSGKNSHRVLVYPSSDCFEGEYSSFMLTADNPMWSDIQEQGFLKTALQYLSRQ